MKIREWLKTMWIKLTRNTVSNVDKLELEMNKIETCLKNVDDSYYKSKGKEKSLIDRKEELEIRKQKLVVGAKKVLEKNDDVMLLRIKKEIDCLDNSIKDITTNIAISNSITQKLYEQRSILSSKLSESKMKFETLKMKNEFTKDINDIASVIGNDVISTNFDELAKTIEDNYNSSGFKLEDMNKEKSVEQLISESTNEEDLESFKTMLKGE